MTPVFDPAYWDARLAKADAAGHLHWSVYESSHEVFDSAAVRHASVLAREVGPRDRILDAGCGYGRLLDILPASWAGEYLGVDLSPSLIERARALYGHRSNATFLVGNLRNLPAAEPAFDLAVCVSVRGMVVREAGSEEWTKIETALRRAARRVLLLEYRADVDGDVLDGWCGRGGNGRTGEP